MQEDCRCGGWGRLESLQLRAHNQYHRRASSESSAIITATIIYPFIAADGPHGTDHVSRMTEKHTPELWALFPIPSTLYLQLLLMNR